MGQDILDIQYSSNQVPTCKMRVKRFSLWRLYYRPPFSAPQKASIERGVTPYCHLIPTFLQAMVIKWKKRFFLNISRYICIKIWFKSIHTKALSSHEEWGGATSKKPQNCSKSIFAGGQKNELANKYDENRGFRWCMTLPKCVFIRSLLLKGQCTLLSCYTLTYIIKEILKNIYLNHCLTT